MLQLLRTLPSMQQFATVCQFVDGEHPGNLSVSQYVTVTIWA